MREDTFRLSRRFSRVRASAALAWVVSLSMTVAPLPATAQEDDVLGRYWAAYAAVDYSTWDGLGDVTPVGRGGPFETDGVGISFGGYTSVARLGPSWLLLGGELGFLGLNSDVIFEPGTLSGEPESAFEVNHVTASAVLRLGDPGERYVDFGLGLGQYVGDTRYIDCSVILRCFAAQTSDRSLGLSLSIAGTPGYGLILGANIHLVHFDPIEAVDLSVQGLDGPIYSLFIGWEYSNWRRD